MNKNIVKGKVRQVEGKAENVAGAVTGNVTQEIDGKLKQTAGKIQEEFGRAADHIKRSRTEKTKNTE